MRGDWRCCCINIENVNLDAVWGAIMCSLAYFIGGAASLWPYLLPLRLDRECLALSVASTVVVLLVGGLWKGWAEVSWRSTASRWKHGCLEAVILILSCLVAGGCAIGIVQVFNRLPFGSY